MANFTEQIARGNGARSLHQQVYQHLKTQIHEQQMPPGEQLPSEAQLTNRYSVSRHVVRQALKRLVSEGWITVHQGAGYFVNRPRVRRALPTLTSFTTAMAATGATVRTEVVSQRIATVTGELRERLCAPDGETAVSLVRVASLDDEACTIIRGWYPMRYAEKLLAADLTNRSVYRLLEEEYGVRPRNASSTLSVGYATAGEAELLGVPDGTAMLDLESWTWQETGELVEYSLGSYRADRFEFAVDQRYPEGANR